MSTTTIGAITRHSGVAGQYSYDVTVTHCGVDDGVAWTDRAHVSFVGSTYGEPGPITAVTASGQIHVCDPGRFGDTLSPEWIRRFYGVGA